jgi:hypothetical protein
MQARYFYCCIQVFKSLKRDRLTALAIFFRLERVPAGRVLANQGSLADRLYLIDEGEIAYILEGCKSGNPMKPTMYRASDPIPGLTHIAPGSSFAIRIAIEKNAHNHSGPDRYAVRTSITI